MSLIHTCQLCGANSFDYLSELQRHAQELAASPAEWMPWNSTRQAWSSAGGSGGWKSCFTSSTTPTLLLPFWKWFPRAAAKPGTAKPPEATR